MLFFSVTNRVKLAKAARAPPSWTWERSKLWSQTFPETPNVSTAMLQVRIIIPGEKNSWNWFVLISDPDWASINLGVLMCIECSGVHRKLGSHISRVRSLDLDEWPPGHLAVMSAMGNVMANSIWESKLKSGQKPCPTSSQEDKERFIMAKYNNKEFLSPMPPGLNTSASLVDSICRYCDLPVMSGSISRLF